MEAISFNNTINKLREDRWASSSRVTITENNRIKCKNLKTGEMEGSMLPGEYEYIFLLPGKSRLEFRKINGNEKYLVERKDNV